MQNCSKLQKKVYTETCHDMHQLVVSFDKILGQKSAHRLYFKLHLFQKRQCAEKADGVSGSAAGNGPTVYTISDHSASLLDNYAVYIINTHLFCANDSELRGLFLGSFSYLNMVLWSTYFCVTNTDLISRNALYQTRKNCKQVFSWAVTVAVLEWRSFYNVRGVCVCVQFIGHSPLPQERVKYLKEKGGYVRGQQDDYPCAAARSLA